MSAEPSWLPPLITMESCGGDWNRWLTAVYDRFRRDFCDSRPSLSGQRVACRRDPVCQGKEAGFWHCVSEGDTEIDRTPDPRRCERIGWIRAIIENSNDATIDKWENNRNGGKRILLWFREEILVVLAQRNGYLQLITAYPTVQEHRRRKLRAERDEWRSKSG